MKRDLVSVVFFALRPWRRTERCRSHQPYRSGLHANCPAGHWLIDTVDATGDAIAVRSSGGCSGSGSAMWLITVVSS